MKRLLILLLLLSVGLNIGLFAALKGERERVEAAETGPMDWRDGPGRHMPPEQRAAFHKEGRRLWQEMPPEDRERVRTMRQALDLETAPLREELGSARLALRDAMAAQVLDDALIETLMDRMTATQARLDSTIAHALMEQLRTSTPEERRRFLKMMPWERGGRGRRQDGGGPR